MRWAGLSVEANPVAMGRGGSVIVVIDEGWVHSGESILFGDHIIVQNGIWDERAGDMMEGGIRKKKKKRGRYEREHQFNAHATSSLYANLAVGTGFVTYSVGELDKTYQHV